MLLVLLAVLIVFRATSAFSPVALTRQKLMTALAFTLSLSSESFGKARLLLRHRSFVRDSCSLLRRRLEGYSRISETLLASIPDLPWPASDMLTMCILLPTPLNPLAMTSVIMIRPSRVPASMRDCHPRRRSLERRCYRLGRGGRP